MASARIIHTFDKRALTAVLTSPNGAIAKDLFRRGKKVETRAKANLERSPRRVDTGLLRSSIHAKLVSAGGLLAVQISTNVYYAIYVHNGTGIYGPRGSYIYPRNAKMLSWRKNGKRVFAHRVKGMRPNPFLKDAIIAAKD